MAKRPIAHSTDEDSDDPQDNANVTAPTGKKKGPKRTRTATTKQAALDAEQAAKQAREKARLQAKNAKLMKRLQALQAQLDNPDHAPNTDEDPDDPDRTPPESEDEDDESEGEGINLSGSIRKGPIIPAPSKHTPRISRREGDPMETRTLNAATPSRSSTSPIPPQAGHETTIAPAAPTTSPAPTMLAPPPPPMPAPPPAAAANLVPPAATQTPAASSPAPAPMPDPSAVPAPYAGGVVPASNSRPKAGDYIDEVKTLLLRAIEFYSCSIFTEDAFPNDAKQEKFVADAWMKASQESEDQVKYVLSERMKRVVGLRKSNARGDVSDILRSQTASAYKFRDGVSKPTERHNTSLYQDLTRNGAYHHKEIDSVTQKPKGFAQHPYIPKAIRMAFFGKGALGLGFTFPEAFNPIRTETVAFLLTVFRFHLEEWREGKHVQGQFKEADFGQIYKGLIKDIKAWTQPNETAWMNIRSKWYKRAYRAGGGVAVDDAEVRVPQAILDDAQAELLGRTGLTDSEGEEE